MADAEGQRLSPSESDPSDGGQAGSTQSTREENDDARPLLRDTPPAVVDNPPLPSGAGEDIKDPPDIDSEDPAGKLPPIPETFTRIHPEQEVWVDNTNKHVLLGGRICFREGALEFFACIRGSKEHESIVAVNALASTAHLGLLTIGLEPGKPVQWDPEYVAATGPSLRIDVIWLEDGEQFERPAREMVYNAREKKPLDVDWVFGGSYFFVDPETNQQYYMADGGEFISVSNFRSATIDLPIESTSAEDWLLFTARTDMIPPLGTPVLLRLSERKE